MKQTRIFFRMVTLAVGLAMTTSVMTSCSKDDNAAGIPDVPSIGEYVVTKGMLILNNGNSANGIDGSLTFVDFSNNTANQKVFRGANGMSLGGSSSDVLVHGEKIYIAGSNENAVFVVNAKSFKLIEKISTTDEMGDEEGVMPRHLVAYGDKVYVSTYGGYVAAIDTLELSIKNMYKAGSYPEGMAISATANGGLSLYVANSDYGNGNGSISKIDLASKSVTEFENEKIHNPQQLAVVGDVIYVLDGGCYDEIWEQKGAGVYVINGSNVFEVVTDATGMALAGYSIFTYNNPYGSNKLSYSVYNYVYGSLGNFNLSGDDNSPIYSPCAIGADPNTGRVYIASRVKDPDTGYPSYKLPGYVNAYTRDGQFIGSYPTGVEPCAITFIYGTEKEQY